MRPPDETGEDLTGRWRASRVIRPVFQVLLVGVICSASTEIGFAFKFPPHHISPLWPTGAILFSVLVVTPVRHWWAYTLAAYFFSVINDAREGFPISALLFIVAGVLEICIAAAGVRRFAGGLRAFESLRSLVAYIIIAVVVAPFTSAFVAAFAGAAEDYWFYWRVWFLSEALAFLMLAPAILTWIAGIRTVLSHASLRGCVEACLIGCGLVAISILVFNGPTPDEGSLPALVYLPLPLLLWAAIRFGPIGVSSSLLIVAFLSISGAVRGRGPFATSTPADNVLSLQLFLVVLSLPLMFLAALIAEGQEKTRVLRDSQRELQTLTGRLIQAQETERQRIARELHDDLNQDLALLSVEMDLLSQKPPESADLLGTRLQELSEHVRQMSSSVHDLSHRLHPSRLAQLGLVAAVRSLCKELSQHYGLPIEFTHHEAPDAMPEDSALCLYRIVQEALANVVKHSGARHAGVDLTGTANAILLRIVDDGAGFDAESVAAKGGLGLVSMRERLRLVGGELAIKSRPTGTRIVARVPFADAGRVDGALPAEPARIRMS